MATVMQEAQRERQKRQERIKANKEATHKYHEQVNERATDSLLADIANKGGIQCAPSPDHSGAPAFDEERPVVVHMHPATWAKLANKASKTGYKIKGKFIWLPPSCPPTSKK